MKTLLAVLVALVRLVLPARGLHAAPRDVQVSDRVRVDRLPRVDVQVDGEPAPAPRVQVADGNGADRVPVPRTAAQEAGRSRVRPYAPHDVQGDTRGRDAEEPRASLVRPYLVHWEREQERARVDRSRLGMAVLLDLATEVSR